MSEAPIVPVTVVLLDREYHVACRDGEQAALREAAAYLDQTMRRIRDAGRIIGVDRIAVMAALNITHELLQLRALQNEQQRLAQRIADLRAAAERAAAGAPDDDLPEAG